MPIGKNSYLKNKFNKLKNFLENRKTRRGVENRFKSAHLPALGIIGGGLLSAAVPPLGIVGMGLAVTGVSKGIIDFVCPKIKNASSVISFSGEMQQNGLGAIKEVSGLPLKEKKRFIFVETLNAFSNLPAKSFHTRTHDAIIQSMKELEKLGLVKIDSIKEGKPRSLFSAQITLGLKPSLKKVPYYDVKFTILDKRIKPEELQKSEGYAKLFELVEQGLYKPKLDQKGNLVCLKPDKKKIKEVYGTDRKAEKISAINIEKDQDMKTLNPQQKRELQLAKQTIAQYFEKIKGRVMPNLANNKNLKIIQKIYKAKSLRKQLQIARQINSGVLEQNVQKHSPKFQPII